MFDACGPYQWAREFLKNSLEAKADRVEFGIEWQSVEKHGAYRRTVIDNGSGMSPDDLLRFFSTLGAGDKKIGGVHDNFGVGAKIASLPWNPDGVIVISARDGRQSMIHIKQSAEGQEYELVEWVFPGTRTCVIDPTAIDWNSIDSVDWGVVLPDWAREHGTAVVLLGSQSNPDTVLGNEKGAESDIKGLSVYLNSRFWDLTKVRVVVVELRSDKKNSWPLGPDDKDDARRPNNRQVMGARYYLSDVPSQKGKLAHHGTLALEDGRVAVSWFLWEGERPFVHSYARRPGYIAVKYRDELYEITSLKPAFRQFGVVEGKVQQNLFIIVEPQFYDRNREAWGVHPDQSRNRLIFSGDGEKGAALPMSDWGLEFMQRMPGPVLDAIKEARGDHTGSVEDEEYRKRLQDKFGNRWRFKALVQRNGGTRSGSDPDPLNVGDKKGEGGGGGGGGGERRPGRATVQIVKLKSGDPNQPAEERNVPVDVPQYHFGRKTDFEKDWHLCTWAPNDPRGPTVIINLDSPILMEAIKYHQDQYPEVHAEEVQRTVLRTYGEVAVCKVAHSQKLAGKVSEQELKEQYRSDAALTVALLGLIAEESLIAVRLGKLGRKKEKGVVGEVA
jgi:hypothetical protein